MPGGVPSSLLAYPNGGIDGLGAIMNAVYDYVSPFLLSRLIQADVNMQSFKRGEQFASTITGTPGTNIIGQNFLTSSGFENAISKMVAATPLQITSTANLGSVNTLTIPTNYQRGYQGSPYAEANQYLMPPKNLLSNEFLTNLRAHIAQVSRASDKQMFNQIWGSNYITESKADGTAMTSSTATFASDITQAPVTMNLNLTSATNMQTAAVQLANIISQCYYQQDADGYSLQMSAQPMYLIVPDFAFQSFVNILGCAHANQLRMNAWASDSSYSQVNALYATYNNITLVSVPYQWFYTVSGSTNDSYLCIAVVPDSIGWYAPKQNGNLIDMLRGFDAIAGFSMIPQMSSQQIGQFFASNLVGGPNPAMTGYDLEQIASRYSDPMLGMIHESINSRYPDPYGQNHEGHYSPLCYGLYAYQMGPSTVQATSYQTAMQVTRFCGALRTMPQYIVPFYIDPTLVSVSPPTWSNPYTTTYAAFQTMSENDFCEYAYAHPNLVEEDLKSNEVYSSVDMTAKEIIEKKLGTDYKRRSKFFDVESTEKKTLRGYQNLAQKPFTAKSTDDVTSQQLENMKSKFKEKKEGSTN